MGKQRHDPGVMKRLKAELAGVKKKRRIRCDSDGPIGDPRPLPANYYRCQGCDIHPSMPRVMPDRRRRAPS